VARLHHHGCLAVPIGIPDLPQQRPAKLRGAFQTTIATMAATAAVRTSHCSTEATVTGTAVATTVVRMGFMARMAMMATMVSGRGSGMGQLGAQRAQALNGTVTH